jgi:hypothetical protein
VEDEEIADSGSLGVILFEKSLDSVGNIDHFTFVPGFDADSLHTACWVDEIAWRVGRIQG